MTTDLICPKCGASMRSYERNRVLVDQCTGCGGLFLDRGELEALVAAETAWHNAAQPGQAAPQDRGATYPGGAPQAYDQPAAPAYGGQAQAYGQPAAQGYPQAPHATYSKAYGRPAAQAYGQAPYAKHSKAHYGYRKRRSFLSELFDD